MHLIYLRGWRGLLLVLLLAPALSFLLSSLHLPLSRPLFTPLSSSPHSLPSPPPSSYLLFYYPFLFFNLFPILPLFSSLIFSLLSTPFLFSPLTSVLFLFPFFLHLCHLSNLVLCSPPSSCFLHSQPHSVSLVSCHHLSEFFPVRSLSLILFPCSSFHCRHPPYQKCNVWTQERMGEDGDH